MIWWSSTVRMRLVSFAALASSGTSIGLMVWMLMTRALMPSLASAAAASTAGPTVPPEATMVRSLPSTSVTPLPNSYL